MLIRQLRYLTALARERHFARAAEACNITQPTLSAALKQLEDTLGVLVVERGRRFVGFTPEGEAVLAWARRVLADYESLGQELGEMKDGVVGVLRIGAIPVTLPVVDLLIQPFTAAHPRARTTVLSLTSVEIQRGLDEFDLDVGLTYLDNEPLKRVRTLPLYDEAYRLLTPAEGPFAGRTSVSWAEAASLPLCLLTQNMQNRRILDMHFREAGVSVQPVLETNSLLALLSVLRGRGWSTVLPRTSLSMLNEPEGLETFPLDGPQVFHQVGLVASERDPLPPLARALFEIAGRGAIDFDR